MSTFKTSKTREKILSKIRNGLNKAKVQMPFPEAEKSGVGSIFTYDDRIPAEEAFAAAFTNLGGKFVFCDNEQELLDSINSLYDSRGWKELICADEAILKLFHNNKMTFVHPVDPAKGSADACITSCEALVGRTGSILLSSSQHFGRVASVFYPVHIVVAYADQALKDIDEGLAFMKAKYKGKLPSMINLNTGPSRTADIEKTLVVGVHGPAEVFCFFINA